MDLEKLAKKIKEENQKFHAIKDEIRKVIVGQEKVIDRLLIALLCNGHVLLEGLPGLAKTLIMNTLAKVIDCKCKRIQFTPDLLPADLIGTTIYNPKEGTFSVNRGPIFTNILLADEINRAPAKVQSALLEVMQERQVTISGETHCVQDPFLVLATQNPIEHEGVYPLPEAEIDRFMIKIRINYPTMEEEKEILKRMGNIESCPKTSTVVHKDEILSARFLVDQVYIDEKVIDYILNLVFATRDPEKFGLNLEPLIMYGASPRASLALKLGAKAYAFLQGRSFVTPYDIKQIGHDILRHRIKRSYEAEAEEVSSDEILNQIFESVPVP